jgi:hypothetical protein
MQLELNCPKAGGGDRQNDLTHVLHRPVESAPQSGHTKYFPIADSQSYYLAHTSSAIGGNAGIGGS